MLKLKKAYQKQTLVLKDGTLVTSANISRDRVQKILASTSSLAYMLESEDEKPQQPATGGGGAGDPRPKKQARTTKK